MLPIVGYFLAAVLVLSGLLGSVDLHMAVPVLSLVAVASAFRFYAPNFKRGTWIALLCVVLLGNMLYWCQWSQLTFLPQVCMYLAALVLVGFSIGVCKCGFLSALGFGFTGLALIHMWAEPWLGGDTYAGVLLMAWSLAVWPFLSLVSHGRLLVFITVFGLVGISSMVYKMSCAHDVPHQLLWEMVTQFWAHSSMELTVIQCVLVVVSVAPLLVSSGLMWRWTSVFGIFFIAAPLSVVVLTGPWYGELPILLWYVIYPASVCLVIGILGMLCTVRQVELLNDTAVRSLALGIGASAVLLLPLIHEIPSRADMIVMVAPAIAPVIWGTVLAVLISIASFVAHFAGKPASSTTTWHEAKSKIVVSLKLRWKSYAKFIYREVTGGKHQILNPSSFVPLLIFCSTYSLFPLLFNGVWVAVILVFVGFAFAKLWSQSIVLWTLANALLLVAACVAFSMHWVLGLSVMAMMILLLWIFVRWPAWNASWVYTACLVVVTSVQIPILMLHGEDPIPTLLACGITVLLCNGLQDGRARWLILPVTSFMTLSYLSWWVDRSDPFAMKMIINTEQRWWPLLYCIPPLSVIFYVLLWSRQRMLEKQGFYSLHLDWRQQILIVYALLAVTAWCFSWRPGRLEAGLAIIIMLLNYRSLYQRLVAMPHEAFRWPLLDALTILLASLLIHAGDCYSFFLEHQRNTGTVQAGSLGRFVGAAERDVYACIGAAMLLFIVMRLQSIQIMYLAVWSRLLRLWRGKAPPAKEVLGA